MQERIPRPHTAVQSSGGKINLLGISKRGNAYLRRLFVHGARSVVANVDRSRHPLGSWMDQLEARMHRNALIVAVANKIARITWAVLASGELYQGRPPAVS